MGIRLTVLGKSPAWQDRDGASSGYLVEAGATRLLIDCGSGVFAKLRRLDAYERIDAVVLSHIHADHMLDLVPFSYALTYGPKLRDGAPALYVPPGGRAALSALCGSWDSPTLIEDAFELHEYDPAVELAVGDARLRFAVVPHYVASHAIDLRANGADGRRLVFSGDCAWNDELVELARDADLLLVESTLLADGDRPDPGHLSAAQAGELARRASARRVVLTHFSDQLDREELRTRAEAAFGGPVELATEGASYTI